MKNLESKIHKVMQKAFALEGEYVSEESDSSIVVTAEMAFLEYTDVADFDQPLNEVVGSMFGPLDGFVKDVTPLVTVCGTMMAQACIEAEATMKRPYIMIQFTKETL